MNENFYHILYVEDDEDDYIIIRNLLNRIEDISCSVTWKDNYDAAVAELEQKKYDLCLLDFHLAERTGLEFLEYLRHMNFDMPVIFLTGKGNREIDMEAMRRGAVDYLAKSELNLSSLERSIRYAMANYMAEIEHRKLEALKTTKELAAAVAHEYAQPMQVLKVYLGLMKDGVLKPQYAEKCYNQLIRLESLTDHLRNITGIEKKNYLDSKILDIKASCAATRSLNKGDRILIVDDEKDVLETLLDLFGQSGFVCDGAVNGIQALERFNKNEYKLIISDVMMPGMPGPVLFQKVQELEYSGLFIFITGFEVSKEYDHIMKQADAVLNKPISYFNFLEQVEKISNG